MVFKTEITTIFDCSLERAFKTPMLCDVTKIHTGFGLMPAVIYCKDDEYWGKPGSTKKVFVSKSWTQNGGFASIDKVIERVENKYWKIEVSEFQAWMLGFYKFVGEWSTKETSNGQIEILYTYFLYSNSKLMYPFDWLFTKLFWKSYMKRVLENVRKLAYCQEKYLYE